ncbi:MAG: hypothetical protein ACOYKZ_04505 [Chlamydiia bacterium]
MRKQTPEEKENQRKELERHRAAQQTIPQTLGLAQEQFDAQLAAEIEAVAQQDAAQPQAVMQEHRHWLLLYNNRL